MTAFNKLSNKLIEVEKIPTDYGSGEQLYRAEIHTIAYIGNHPDINVTNLAKIMGVTKGAISQSIKKLEKKKLVERYHNSTNNKEILLRLTKKGEIDFHGHEAYHAKQDSELLETLEELTPTQIEFVENLLEKMEAAFDRRLSLLK